MRSLISLLALVAAVLYGVGVWLFLLHKDDPLPSKADAVVVLAGSDKRLPVALALVHRGVARTLVVSDDTASRDPARHRLCAGPKPRSYRLVCLQATPFSTRGEVRAVSDLARQRHWLSLVVVSSRYHLVRVERLFARCTDARLSVRGTDADTWLQKAAAVPLEWAKLGRAYTLQRGC